MKIKYKQIEIVLILTVTAVICNFIIDLDLVKNINHNGLHNQALFLAIGYICISKLMAIKQKYKNAIIIGQLFFIAFCAFLYYATSISDYIALGVGIYTIISSIILLQDEQTKLNKEG